MEIKKSKEEKIEELDLKIKNCKKCNLWKTRNKPLVGDGSIHADILLIGESPGYNENLVGKAFVGEAGKILDKLLSLINLKRDEIYITNILKCHPPKNHNPSRQEIDSCIGYLHEQIKIIKPKIILTLGKYASKEVFTNFNLIFTRISDFHGKIFEAETGFGKLENLFDFPNSLKSKEFQRKIKIIPLYHPAVACYHNEMLDVLKEDFKKLGNVVK